ncbi:hypothetical protein ACIQRE_03800 [Streptomyces griseoluteus]|uniref:hypothetical protein n=1 Tax=Streptomyces griseoluteus TaxID=29306 RepID=UPI003815E6A9
MTGKKPNQRLAALLAEAEWSGADLGRSVNALGRAQNLSLQYDRTSVAHWLSGTRPRHPAPGLIAAALSRRLGRPVTAADAGLTRTPQPAATSPGLMAESHSTRHALITTLHADMDPVQRVRLTRSSYLPLAPPVLRDAVGQLATPTPWQPDVHTPLAAVEELDDMSEIFARLSLHYGGGHPRRLLTHYLADQAGTLLRAHPEHTELLAATGRLLHLLAAMTADADAQALAQRYYHLAYALAHQARHRHQAAITLRALSAQATLLRHQRYAHDLSDAAVTAAGPRAPASVRAFLLAQRALTHAHLGDARPALAALTGAERAHEQASSLTGPFTSYPRAALDFQRGAVLARLGEHQAAQRAFERSISQRNGSEHRPLALTHARTATHLLGTGHLDAACHHWHAFLDHFPHLESAPARENLASLTRHLLPHRRRPPVAALLDRAHHLASQ